jgi:lipopolysaccharide transport system permease protein
MTHAPDARPAPPLVPIARTNPASPAAMVRSVVAHRQLILQLIRRDVVGRYRGSLMGLAWSFLNPLLMLGIYTFVFSVVFKARWGVSTGDTTAGFAVILFVGLIVHGLFAECINRAPGLVLANPNYVKRVIFPLEILPWVAMGSALFHGLASFGVLFAAQLLVNHTLPWTVMLLPVVVLPLLLMTMGAAWFLAALGVFVRDIGQMTGMIVSVMMFLSPVFYPVSSLPARLQRWIFLNPLTYPIEDARAALVVGRVPPMSHILVATAVGLVVAQVGFWWFQRARRGFADVI